MKVTLLYSAFELPRVSLFVHNKRRAFAMDINDLHPPDDYSHRFFIWHEWIQVALSLAFPRALL